MMNSKDLLARLLANENLNVIRANVSTASFEGVTRTLTLPIWKDMSDELEEMLIGHEVGHALFTTYEFCEKPDFRKLQGYMNVIEDVRIEKKVKNKYPGLRKQFITAYKQLADKDFFGIQDKDLSKLLLIDKINLYYKVGINCGVKFTPDEMEFCRRVDRCDTMKDVYVLAQEIYAHSKDQRDAQKQAMDELMQSLPELEDEDDINSFMDDPDDFDNTMTAEETEEEEETEDGKATNQSSTKEVNNEAIEEEELRSATQRAFDERLGELADTKTMVQKWIPELEGNRNPVVSYKNVLTDLSFSRAEWIRNRVIDYGHSKEWAAAQAGELSKKAMEFKDSSMKEVNYLVKEFEMKKSAAEYRRTSEATSGDLNPRKLYAYKLTDDIFRKMEITPEDKNHGMVLLLDWSGSMTHVIGDTLDQVMNLVMFCRRVQIPFHVFAFTNGYEDVQRQYSDETTEKFQDSNFHLLELFSNKMTNVEFNKMVELMVARPYHYDRRYGLHSTPLNESLLFLAGYLGQFIKSNGVEKMSLVTLTDGEGHGVAGRHRNLREYGYQNGMHMKVRNILVDPITKKEYRLASDGTQQTRVFLNVIKDRYNIKTVGFHILSNSRREVESFLRYNLPSSNTSTRIDMVEQIRKDIRQHDFASIANTGRDEMFLLPANKQRIVEEDLEVDAEMNARALATKFGRFMNVKKSSRVVMNRFVTLIA